MYMNPWNEAKDEVMCMSDPEQPRWTTVAYVDFAIRWRLNGEHVVDWEVAQVMCINTGEYLQENSADPSVEWPRGQHWLEGYVKSNGCVFWEARDRSVLHHECGPELTPRIGRVMLAVYMIGQHAFGVQNHEAWTAKRPPPHVYLMTNVSWDGEAWTCGANGLLVRVKGRDSRQKACEEFDRRWTRGT